VVVSVTILVPPRPRRSGCAAPAAEVPATAQKAPPAAAAAPAEKKAARRKVAFALVACTMRPTTATSRPFFLTSPPALESAGALDPADRRPRQRRPSTSARGTTPASGSSIRSRARPRPHSAPSASFTARRAAARRRRELWLLKPGTYMNRSGSRGGLACITRSCRRRSWSRMTRRPAAGHGETEARRRHRRA